jgi:hypothetical protein
MAPDLDPRLEDATRQAFTRLLDAIEVTVPDRPPAAEPAAPPLRHGQHGQHGRHGRHRRRPRTLMLAGAGLAAAAAIAVALLVVPDDSPERTSTEGPSTTTTTTAPETTTSPSTSTTADTTTTTGEPPSSSTTSTTIAPPTEPTLRRAERLPPLDPATSRVPLDGLTDVAADDSANGSVTLQAAGEGDLLAMRLSAPWLTGFEPGIEGTRRELETYWMVSTVYNQHVVWGVASDEVRRVDVYLTDGQVVSADTVDFPQGGVTSMFVIVLPQLATIENLAGIRADGSVLLAGSQVEESQAQISQWGRHLQEWTAFIPMVVH